MKANYFNSTSTVEQIKRNYRELAMRYHPDRGGDTRTMQLINDEYLALLKNCHGQISKDDKGKEHSYKYDETIEKSVIEKLKQIIGLSKDDWTIMLIGSWIWIDGTRKEDKDRLNKNGAKCLWHSKKNLWYWRPDDSRSYSRGKGNLSSMAWKYGYKEFAPEHSKAIN
jgi:hypothetical protein